MNGSLPNALFLAALMLAAAFVALRLILCRPHLAERWLGYVMPRTGNRPGVLLYAASHGELLLLERLLPMLKGEQPRAELMILVPTRRLLQLARERFAGARSYCVTPLLPTVRRRLLECLRPDLFVVIEFARIPLWVGAAQRHGVALAIVNGRISRKNLRACRRWPLVFRPMLAAFDRIEVQTAADAEDFLRFGARPAAVNVTGQLKFDAAVGERTSVRTRELAALAGIAERDVVLLAGSTTGDEEERLTEIYQRLAPRFPQLRLILVPRNRRRFGRVARMLRRRGVAFQQRSELVTSGAGPPARVLLIDTVGELAAWWGTADIGFVGASLVPRGGHNMIEPAAQGVATSFGPHTVDFRDVVELLTSREAAVQVVGPEQLQAFVEHCLIDPAYAAALGERARETCRSQTGAMLRTCQRLSRLLRHVRGQSPVRHTAPAPLGLPAEPQHSTT